MSQVNEEVRKARHKKFFSIYAAHPTMGKIKNKLSGVKRYLSAYSPVSIANPQFVEPTEWMYTPKKFTKNMIMVVLAFFLITSFDIGRASLDAGEGWQVQFEGDALALSMDESILSDQEGYLLKAMPLSGEATYQTNRKENVTYTVQSGDTMSGIAYRFGLSQNSIMAANDITNANKLKTGQDLSIPPRDGAWIEVEDGDTLEEIVEEFKGDYDATLEFNDQITDPSLLAEGDLVFVLGEDVAIEYLDSIKPVYTASSSSSSYTSSYNGNDVGTSYLNTEVETSYASADFVYPTQGSLTQGYYSGHYAYDIADRSQPAIVAVSDGTVVTAAYGWNGGYGNYVVIDHGNGYKTLYAHNEELYVSEGDYVTMGQAIGKMGNTGRVYGATGIHLHFEISYNGYKFPACDVGICY